MERGEKEPRRNNLWKFSLKSIRCYSRRIRLNATTENKIFFLISGRCLAWYF